MHVNFGIMEPLATRVRNKRDRYAAYAARGAEAIEGYRASLAERGLMPAGAPSSQASRDDGPVEGASHG